MVSGASALLFLLFVWNVAFRNYARGSAYHGDVFRGAFNTFFSPFYGQPEAPEAGTVIVVFLLALLLGTLVARRVHQSGSWHGPGVAASLLVYQGMMLAAFALTDGPVRLFANTVDYLAGFGSDTHLFDGAAEILATYVDRMHTLTGHNHNYPPGSLMVLEIGENLGLPGLLRWAVVGATLLAAVLTRQLARLVGLDLTGSVLAMALLVASAGPLVYPTTHMMPLTMTLALMAQLALLVGLTTGSRAAAVGGGLAMSILTLFSFVAVIVGLGLVLLVGAAVAFRATDTRRVMATGSLALATYVIFFAILRAVSGFDLLDCFLQATGYVNTAMTQDAFDTAGRYLLRSTGNVLAYLAYAGLGLTVLAVAAWRHFATMPAMLRAFATSQALTFLIAGFSGLFFMETERIWIFFTPSLAVLAAYALAERGSGPHLRTRLLALGLVAGTACVQELFWSHHQV